MTPDQFESCLKGFLRRRPFQAFLVEFASGNHIRIAHPDAIRAEGELFVFRSPNGGYVVFPAGSITRLLDVSALTGD
jgi:hypothetical protein